MRAATIELDTRTIREKLKMSPTQFAQALDVSVQTVLRWEKENRVTPKAYNMIKLLEEPEPGINEPTISLRIVMPCNRATFEALKNLIETLKPNDVL